MCVSWLFGHFACVSVARRFVTNKGVERFKIVNVVKEKPVLLCEVEVLDEDDDETEDVSVFSFSAFCLCVCTRSLSLGSGIRMDVRAAALTYVWPAFSAVSCRCWAAGNPTCAGSQPCASSSRLTAAGLLVSVSVQAKKLGEEVAELFRNVLRLHMKMARNRTSKAGPGSGSSGSSSSSSSGGSSGSAAAGSGALASESEDETLEAAELTDYSPRQLSFWIAHAFTVRVVRRGIIAAC